MLYPSNYYADCFLPSMWVRQKTRAPNLVTDRLLTRLAVHDRPGIHEHIGAASLQSKRLVPAPSLGR